MSGLDLAQANAFLAALGMADRHTFQTFAEAPGCALRPRILHGTLERLASALTSLNRRGAGVFVLINEGDGRGRRRANIIRIRALFADFDGAPLPERWRLEPHAIIRSSPGRYHVYWRVQGVPLAAFRKLQRALAAHHGSDPSVSDPSRVMRLPGSVHRKGEPFRVAPLQLRAGEAYTLAQVRNAWPPARPSLEAAPLGRPRIGRNGGGGAPARTSRPSLGNPLSNAHRPGLRARDAQAILQRERTRVGNAPRGERNTTLNLAAFRLGRLVGAGALERCTAAGALLAAAHRCGLDDHEAARTLRSGLEAGILIGSVDADPTRRPWETRDRRLGRRITRGGGGKGFPEVYPRRRACVGDGDEVSHAQVLEGGSLCP